MGKPSFLIRRAKPTSKGRSGACRARRCSTTLRSLGLLLQKVCKFKSGIFIARSARDVAKRVGYNTGRRAVRVRIPQRGTQR